MRFFLVLARLISVNAIYYATASPTIIAARDGTPAIAIITAVTMKRIMRVFHGKSEISRAKRDVFFIGAAGPVETDDACGSGFGALIGHGAFGIWNRTGD